MLSVFLVLLGSVPGALTPSATAKENAGDRAGASSIVWTLPQRPDAQSVVRRLVDGFANPDGWAPAHSAAARAALEKASRQSSWDSREVRDAALGAYSSWLSTMLSSELRSGIREQLLKFGLVRTAEVDARVARDDSHAGLAALLVLAESERTLLFGETGLSFAEGGAWLARGGIGLRRTTGHKVMFGVNAFYDWERNEDLRLSFVRTSVGAELWTSWVDLSANRYWGIDQPDAGADGAVYYSADGHDVVARGRLPGTDWAEWEFSRYRWSRLPGDAGADDSGYKAGMVLHLSKALELRLLHDRGKDGRKDFETQLRMRWDLVSDPLERKRLRELDEPWSRRYELVRRENRQKIFKRIVPEPNATGTDETGPWQPEIFCQETAALGGTSVCSFSNIPPQQAKPASARQQSSGMPMLQLFISVAKQITTYGQQNQLSMNIYNFADSTPAYPGMNQPVMLTLSHPYDPVEKGFSVTLSTAYDGPPSELELSWKLPASDEQLVTVNFKHEEFFPILVRALGANNFGIFVSLDVPAARNYTVTYKLKREDNSSSKILFTLAKGQTESVYEFTEPELNTITLSFISQSDHRPLNAAQTITATLAAVGGMYAGIVPGAAVVKQGEPVTMVALLSLDGGTFADFIPGTGKLTLSLSGGAEYGQSKDYVLVTGDSGDTVGCDRGICVLGVTNGKLSVEIRVNSGHELDDNAMVTVAVLGKKIYGNESVEVTYKKQEVYLIPPSSLLTLITMPEPNDAPTRVKVSGVVIGAPEFSPTLALRLIGGNASLSISSQLESTACPSGTPVAHGQSLLNCFVLEKNAVNFTVTLSQGHLPNATVGELALSLSVVDNALTVSLAKAAIKFRLGARRAGVSAPQRVMLESGRFLHTVNVTMVTDYGGNQNLNKVTGGKASLYLSAGNLTDYKVVFDNAGLNDKCPEEENKVCLALDVLQSGSAKLSVSLGASTKGVLTVRAAAYYGTVFAGTFTSHGGFDGTQKIILGSGGKVYHGVRLAAGAPVTIRQGQQTTLNVLATLSVAGVGLEPARGKGRLIFPPPHTGNEYFANGVACHTYQCSFTVSESGQADLRIEAVRVAADQTLTITLDNARNLEQLENNSVEVVLDKPEIYTGIVIARGYSHQHQLYEGASVKLNVLRTNVHFSGIATLSLSSDTDEYGKDYVLMTMSNQEEKYVNVPGECTADNKRCKLTLNVSSSGTLPLSFVALTDSKYDESSKITLTIVGRALAGQNNLVLNILDRFPKLALQPPESENDDLIFNEQNTLPITLKFDAPPKYATSVEIRLGGVDDANTSKIELISDAKYNLSSPCPADAFGCLKIAENTDSVTVSISITDDNFSAAFYLSLHAPDGSKINVDPSPQEFKHGVSSAGLYLLAENTLKLYKGYGVIITLSVLAKNATYMEVVAREAHVELSGTALASTNYSIHTLGIDDNYYPYNTGPGNCRESSQQTMLCRFDKGVVTISIKSSDESATDLTLRLPQKYIGQLAGSADEVKIALAGVKIYGGMRLPDGGKIGQNQKNDLVIMSQKEDPPGTFAAYKSRLTLQLPLDAKYGTDFKFLKNDGSQLDCADNTGAGKKDCDVEVPESGLLTLKVLALQIADSPVEVTFSGIIHKLSGEDLSVQLKLLPLFEFKGVAENYDFTKNSGILEFFDKISFSYAPTKFCIGSRTNVDGYNYLITIVDDYTGQGTSATGVLSPDNSRVCGISLYDDKRLRINTLNIGYAVGTVITLSLEPDTTSGGEDVVIGERSEITFTYIN